MLYLVHYSQKVSKNLRPSVQGATFEEYVLSYIIYLNVCHGDYGGILDQTQQLNTNV